MSASLRRSSAEMIADLEARTPVPLAYVALVQKGAALQSPAFLTRGWTIVVDGALAVTSITPFGLVPKTSEALSGADLAELCLPIGLEYALFLRNRFLLPRLLDKARPFVARLRAILVQLPTGTGVKLDGAGLEEMLQPLGFAPVESSAPAANGIAHQLYERAPVADQIDGPSPGQPVVVESNVRFEDGYLTGELRLDRPAPLPCEVTLFADHVPIAIGPASAGMTPQHLAFRIWSAPELFTSGPALLEVAVTRFAERTTIRRLFRPASRRFVPETLLAGGTASPGKPPLGVLILAGAAVTGRSNPLATLAHHGAQACTHIRLDGPASSEVLEECDALGFIDVVVHQGRIGPDKMAVQALWHMTRRFDRVIVIKGGSGESPAIHAVAAALDRIAPDPDMLGLSPDGSFARDWWAATSNRLQPLVRQLAYLFSLEEADYRAWTREDGSDGALAFDWTDALERLVRRSGLTQAVWSAVEGNEP